MASQFKAPPDPLPQHPNPHQHHQHHQQHQQHQPGHQHPQQPQQAQQHPPTTHPQPPPAAPIPTFNCLPIDAFELLYKIGSGTYGLIWCARFIKTGQYFALKQLTSAGTSSYGYHLTNIREMMLLQSTRHINLVKLFDIACDSDSGTYLVLELAMCDLSSYVKQYYKRYGTQNKETKEHTAFPNLKIIIRELLSALLHLHGHMIIHRDIKSANVLIGLDNHLKISDFGLGRTYGQPQTNMTPQVVTLWYRAPELLLDTDAYTSAIDIWSLGCIFAELVLGRVLFPGNTVVQQWQNITQELGIPTTKIWPSLSTQHYLLQHSLQLYFAQLEIDQQKQQSQYLNARFNANNKRGPPSGQLTSTGKNITQFFPNSHNSNNSHNPYFTAPRTFQQQQQHDINRISAAKDRIFSDNSLVPERLRLDTYAMTATCDLEIASYLEANQQYNKLLAEETKRDFKKRYRKYKKLQTEWVEMQHELEEDDVLYNDGFNDFDKNGDGHGGMHDEVNHHDKQHHNYHNHHGEFHPNFGQSDQSFPKLYETDPLKKDDQYQYTSLFHVPVGSNQLIPHQHSQLTQNTVHQQHPPSSHQHHNSHTLNQPQTDSNSHNNPHQLINRDGGHQHQLDQQYYSTHSNATTNLSNPAHYPRHPQPQPPHPLYQPPYQPQQLLNQQHNHQPGDNHNNSSATAPSIPPHLPSDHLTHLHHHTSHRHSSSHNHIHNNIYNNTARSVHHQPPPVRPRHPEITTALPKFVQLSLASEQRNQRSTPNVPESKLAATITTRSALTASGVDLLLRMLSLDPSQRISAQDALVHPWFREAPTPQPFTVDPGIKADCLKNLHAQIMQHQQMQQLQIHQQQQQQLQQQ